MDTCRTNDVCTLDCGPRLPGGWVCVLLSHSVQLGALGPSPPSSCGHHQTLLAQHVDFAFSLAGCQAYMSTWPVPGPALNQEQVLCGL